MVSARSELGLPSGFSGLPAPGGWEDAGGKGMGSPEGNQLGPHNLNSLQVQPGPYSGWRRGLGGTPKIAADWCHLFI